MTTWLKGLWNRGPIDEKKEDAFFPTVDGIVSPQNDKKVVHVPSVTIPKIPIAGSSSTNTPNSQFTTLSSISQNNIAPLSPRQLNSLSRQNNSRMNLLKQAQHSNEQSLCFDDTNKIVTLKDETYIPLSYAKDKLQQVLADWNQMKMEYIAAIEDIDKHYKQQEDSQLNKMKEFVKEYQLKYKALREKHNQIKEEKSKEFNEYKYQAQAELEVSIDVMTDFKSLE